MEGIMSKKIFINIIAPGFGESETVTEQINILLDFAQFYDFPDYHLLAQTLAVIEQHFGNTLCADLDEEAREFFLDTQYAIVIHAYDKLNSDVQLVNKVTAISKGIHNDPEAACHMVKAKTVDVVYNVFQEMFSEELKDYLWYHRMIAKIIWKFDNWFASTVIRIHLPFMGDMIGQVEYWRMSYQISMVRAFI